MDNKNAADGDKNEDGDDYKNEVSLPVDLCNGPRSLLALFQHTNPNPVLVDDFKNIPAKKNHSYWYR